MVVSPEALPEGPFAWKEGKAALTFGFRFRHPLTGEEVEQYITEPFSEPALVESLLARAIKKLEDTPLRGLKPEDVEWWLEGGSRRRSS
jgi:hypothetical protein